MTSSTILHLDESNFQSTITGTSKPVLVDFWAPWCGPCKAIAPVLDELATDLADKVVIGKIDVDNNQALAGQFGVRAIPTLLVFKNGQVVEQIVGLKSKSELAHLLAAHA